MEISQPIKDDAIRREWDVKSKKWYFSVVDVIAITGQSSDPRNYWKVLKNRLKKTQNELVTECNQLKMIANDGKFYLTDVADEETIFNILKSVSPRHIPLFEDWFGTLSKQALRSDKINGYTSPLKYEGRESYPQEDLMLMIDGYRENDTFVIQAFLAGVNIENIFISSTSKIVTIKGRRGSEYEQKNYSEKENNENDYSFEELSWGEFSRSITLPEEIEISEVEANAHHGLLTIKLPIINKNRSRAIKVKEN